MPRRTVVLFWGATAAAVFFLGWAWAAAGRMSSGNPADLVVFVISLIGFLATAFVAGRIAFVVARLQRRARRSKLRTARSRTRPG